MYTVLKNMDDFYAKAGEKIADKNKAKDCVKKFKEKFWKTYNFLIETAKRNEVALSKFIKDTTGEEFHYAISEQLLLQLLIDAYDDLMRLTEYHPTENPNSLKEMAYIVYWLIRRKPLVITESYEDVINIENKNFTEMGRMHILFINEYFATTLLYNSVFRGKIPKKDVSEKELEIADEQLEIFSGFLFYSLVYRVDSPKYLEAMSLACTIYPAWEVDPKIWQKVKQEIQMS